MVSSEYVGMQKNYQTIMKNTLVDLYELAGNEYNSLEKNLDLLAQLMGAGDKIKDYTHGRIKERRRIIDGLIQKTGGRISLKNLEQYLRELADPENDERISILHQIIGEGVKSFVYDISNEQMVLEISRDEHFFKNREMYGNEISEGITQYMMDYIEKELGIIQK